MRRVDRIPHKFRKQVEAKLEALPELIRRRREEMDLTQEGLAEVLEVSIETMKAIEGGRRYPSLPMLFYLCLYLGIDVNFKTKA